MSTTEDKDEFLTEKELIKRWKITRLTLYTLRDKGECPPSITIGNRRRYRMSDVREYEEKLLQQPPISGADQ
jgi:predicted DNA-binding transcriptional regulator AlpA